MRITTNYTRTECQGNLNVCLIGCDCRDLTLTLYTLYTTSCTNWI